MAAADLVGAIDYDLKTLLGPLAQARDRRVVALSARGKLNYVALLPFHIHTSAPNALDWLGLAATVAVIPFTAADHAFVARPLYRVGDALQARRLARLARYQTHRCVGRDLQQADWEAGAQRGSLHELVLPARAFVQVQRTNSDGVLACLGRGRLGHSLDHDAPRARVIIPGAGKLSTRAVDKLAGADLLIANVQQLRGPQALRTIRAVLAARAPDRPTLIVAASVSDMFAAGFDDAPDPLFVVTTPTELRSVQVITVARDRLAADTSFEASLRGLAEQSADAQHLAWLARDAWWAARGSIDERAGLLERRRFDSALEELARSDAFTAGLFTSCRALLEAARQDDAARVERTSAAVGAATGCAGSVLVLTRTWSDAAFVRTAIAQRIGLDAASLAELGLAARCVRPMPPHTCPDTSVVVGYAGMATIDALVGSGSKNTRLVLDPVEARVAWYHVNKMNDFLSRAGAISAIEPYRFLARGLAPFAVGAAQPDELQFAGSLVEGGDRPPTTLRDRSMGATVFLSDGTRLDVGLGARFEVLGRKGGCSHVRSVTALRPGDEIVLLDEEAHALFSERRIAALDAGPLRAQSEARRLWLELVRSAASSKGLTLAEIARRMTARGQPITAPAVGAWLDADGNSAHAPRQVDSFVVLSELLELPLSAEAVRALFRQIHELRIRHRKAGHLIARAMRLAYAGRLGPNSLARIEREWGVEVRALVAAAHIGVVDEVVLPDMQVA